MSCAKEQTLAEAMLKAKAPTDARKRLTQLFDENSFTELDAYAKASCSQTGVIAGFGYIQGFPVFAFSQDISVKGGAVGRMHAAKIKKLYDLATKTGAPIIGIYDSNGANIDEGADALAAYGDIAMWTSNASGVIPQISIIVGTCAGSSAMIACMSDFVIMTEDAKLFMTPPYLSEEDGAGTAENTMKSGVANFVCENDDDAIALAQKLVAILPANNLSSIPQFEFEENSPATFGNNANVNVMAIADVGSVIEVSGEFGSNAYTALATLAGSTVAFVATNKADGKLTQCDTSKIARFVSICDAYSIPVITLVDTEGFDTENGELAGSIRDSAKLAHAYAEATTTKISVITGKAYGSAYIALAGTNAGADITYAWEGAVISAMEPIAAVEFLWHDKLSGAKDVSKKREELVKEYKSTLATPFEVAAKGYIDDIISPEQTRDALISAIEIMASKRVSKMPKKHSNFPF